MSSLFPPRKDVKLRDVALEDFQYASSHREYFDECNALVDRYGTQAAEPFNLALKIGQHMQDQMTIRNLGLHNLYKGVIDKLLPDVLGGAREKILRDLLYKHWVHGEKLKAAFGEAALPEDFKRPGSDAAPISDEETRPTAEESRDLYERECDYESYRVTYETGPVW